MVETIETIFSARNLFSVKDVELHQGIHAAKMRIKCYDLCLQIWMYPLSQGCIFFHDFLLPSFTNRQNFVIYFLKIISKMSESEHAYSISVKYDVADLVWCVYSLNT